MVSDKKILKDFFCCHGNQSFWNNLSRNSEEEYGRNISVKFHQNRKVVSEKMFKEKVNGQMHRRTHGCTHDRPRHKFAGLWPVELIKVHNEMLHAKNQSSIPSSFREEFWSWSFLFLCSNLWPPTHPTNPQCGVSFDPRGITWIQLIKVHRRCYIPNIKALSPPVSEKKNFEVGLLGSFVPTCDHRGETSFDPPAHDMNKLDRSSYGDAYYQISKLYPFSLGQKYFEVGLLWSCVPTCDPPGRGPVLTPGTSYEQT